MGGRKRYGGLLSEEGRGEENNEERWKEKEEFIRLIMP